MSPASQTASKKNSKPKDQSVCWDCANAANPSVCEWCDSGTPITGWWARPNKIQYTQRNADGSCVKVTTDSYTVIMCPKFVRDGWRAGVYPHENAPSRNILKDATHEDIRKLAAAIIKQAVLDWEKLDCGRFRRVVTSENQTVKATEVVGFFNSGYFEHLLQEVSSVEPETVRDTLGIPSWK